MSLSASPYEGLTQDKWLAKTQELIAANPLSLTEIHDAAMAAWNNVWTTQVGSGAATVPLREVDAPATVIGYFFEKLLAKELENRTGGKWRGGRGSEKDLYYGPEPKFSIEVKSSGQMGVKVFGNRSYGQKLENEEQAKKDKSGYYITANFFGQSLNLLRFGWIDSSDWKAQAASTGQMAGLGDEVYKGKLIPIRGDYCLQAPADLLKGVGPKTTGLLHEKGIHSVSDALRLDGPDAKTFAAVLTAARGYADEFGPIKKG